MRISDWSSDVCSSDLIGYRPYLRIPAHGVADFCGTSKINQTFYELIMDGSLNQQTRAGHAGLAAGRKNAGHDPFDGIVLVSIRKHDIGGFASPQIGRAHV